MTNTPSSRPDVAGIKARAEAATEPPWEEAGISEGDGTQIRNGITAYRGSVEVIVAQADLDSDRTDLDSLDMEFIAHARQDIPALIAWIEKLEARQVKLEAVAHWAQEVYDWPNSGRRKCHLKEELAALGDGDG